MAEINAHTKEVHRRGNSVNDLYGSIISFISKNPKAREIWECIETKTWNAYVDQKEAEELSKKKRKRNNYKIAIAISVVLGVTVAIGANPEGGIVVFLLALPISIISCNMILK